MDHGTSGTWRRSARIAAAAVATAALAAAQGGEGLVTVGPGGGLPSRTGTFNVGDPGILDGDDVFRVALAELAAHAAEHGATGGTLLVLPGPYAFRAPVTVDLAGVTIRGTAGAELNLDHTGSGGIFTIRASDVVIEGLRLVDESLLANRQYLIQAIGPTAGVGLSNLTIRDCSLELANEVGKYVFAYVYLGNGLSELHDLRLLDNEFLLPDEGFSAIDVVRATSVTGLTVLGNTFHGPGLGLPDRGLVLEDVSQALVVGNRFQGLGSPANTALSLVETRTASPLQRRGACISGNAFEGVLADAALDLETPAVAVHANAFTTPLAGGTAQGRGAVRLGPTTGAVVADNEVWGHGATLPAVLLDGHAGSVLVGNQLAGSDATQLRLLGATDAMIGFDTFLSRTAGGPVPAIDILDGGGHHLFGCDAHGGGWTTPLWASSGATIHALEERNHTF